MPTTYTNPRVNAEIPNWPMGGTTRGTAVFYIEQKPGKGERGVRITKHDDSGKVSKPKLPVLCSNDHQPNVLRICNTGGGITT